MRQEVFFKENTILQIMLKDKKYIGLGGRYSQCQLIAVLIKYMDSADHGSRRHSAMYASKLIISLY